MALLLEGTHATDDQLLAMLRDHRGGIGQMLQLLEDPSLHVEPPLSGQTATELGQGLLQILALAERTEAPRSMREAVVNASYAGFLALIDLLKSHSDLPKVPQGRPTKG